MDPDSPRDKHNSLNGAYDDERFKYFISDDLEPIAKGSWSATKDDTTGWAAGYRRYGASKLCGVMMMYASLNLHTHQLALYSQLMKWASFSHELQRRLDQDPLLSNISVLALDPGAMPTGIMRHNEYWFVRKVMFQVVLPLITVFWGWLWPNGAFRTLEKSARDILAAVIACGPSPLSEQPKGLFLNGSEQGEYNTEALDPVKRDVVWRGSVRFAELTGSDTLLERWE